MASLTGVEIASRFPVINADAIEPLSPGITARMRLSIASRRSSITVAYCNQTPRATGGALALIAPSAYPDAPMR
jgi:hypothetical protein